MILSLITVLIAGGATFEKVGIIGALDSEIELIREEMTVEGVDTVSQRILHRGSIGGVPCLLVKGGVGKVNAAVTAQILIREYEVEAIIFSGVAGGINEGLRIGDIVISDRVLQHDYGVVAFGGFTPYDTVGFAADSFLIDIARERAGLIKFRPIPRKITGEKERSPAVKLGRIVTGDQFIASEEERRWLEKTFRADCVEMEGSAVGQVCIINRIPFLIIRCLSDLANEDADVDFDAFVGYAAANSSRLVIEIVKALKK